jgi:hypothetical protein
METRLIQDAKRAEYYYRKYGSLKPKRAFNLSWNLNSTEGNDYCFEAQENPTVQEGSNTTCFKRYSSTLSDPGL